jgi:hypothetical protein
LLGKHAGKSKSKHGYSGLKQRFDARLTEHHRELEQHLLQEDTRLDYATKQADQQNDNVDPENRLIALPRDRRGSDRHLQGFKIWMPAISAHEARPRSHEQLKWGKVRQATFRKERGDD